MSNQRPGPDYWPGLLSQQLGWAWLRVGDTHMLHLTPPLLRQQSRSACGILLRGKRLRSRYESAQVPRYCARCRTRNGGQP